MKTPNKKTTYVICINNQGSEDLVVGKVYQALPDETAAREGYIRVVDESSEDYLYPISYFISVALPLAAEQALFSSTSS